MLQIWVHARPHSTGSEVEQAREGFDGRRDGAVARPRMREDVHIEFAIAGIGIVVSFYEDSR
ncbi:hypothetical protein JW848_00670 [Candidatus Bipolaricaulota bacterium]|nr:hypothetical protein [Candidatus Bipolaricaulota bacterium]